MNDHGRPPWNPPFSNKSPWFSRYLLFGGIGGFAVGILDVGEAAIRDTESLSMTELLTAGLFSGAALTFLGILTGFVFGLIGRRVSLRSLIQRFRRPRNALILFITVAASTVLAGYLAHRRGILLEAVDYRLPIFLFIFLAILAMGVEIRFLKQKAFAKSVVLLLVLSLVGGAGALWSMGKREEAVRLIGEKTRAARPIFGMIRGIFDSDGDGFPHALCGNDCDCDDADPKKSPAAIDIPENRIDEDCSGADLKLASEYSIADEGFIYPKIFSPPYNIVLITVDSLRADRVHAYGHVRETTPNLDRFADESVRFKEVRSQGPSTRHVFPVFLTGRYFPVIAQSKGEKWWTLESGNKTFAEFLKTKGYHTSAVMPYFRFGTSAGFHQGFDHWDMDTADKTPEWMPTGHLVTDRGIAHLDALIREGGPWLLWLHYFDPHAAYLRHDDQPSFGHNPEDMYDGEVLYADRQIGRFFDALKSRGLWNNTAIIVTADHGEALGLETDHGFSYHGFSLYDSEIRVPLLMRIPRGSPRTVSNSVALIDLIPSILELGGLKVPASMHGVSLLPYVFGGDRKRPPFLVHLPEESEWEAAVEWPYKLIWKKRSNRFGLFNLERDPDERNDLMGQHLVEARRLQEFMQLENYLLSMESKSPPPFAY